MTLMIFRPNLRKAINEMEMQTFEQIAFILFAYC